MRRRRHTYRVAVVVEVFCGDGSEDAITAAEARIQGVLDRHCASLHPVAGAAYTSGYPVDDSRDREFSHAS